MRKASKHIAGSKHIKLWHLPVSVVAAFALVAMAGAVLLPAKESNAAPYPQCETRGILFQYPGGNTHEHLIDMVTGASTEPPQSPINGRSINAIGYNVQDHFIYGWDNASGSEQMVRVHADMSVDTLGIPTYASTGDPYTGPTAGIIVGDVDENGDYWFIGGGDWYQVDMTPGSATEGQILNTGSAAGVTGSAGADWGYVPGTNGFYRVMNNGGTGELWKFDRTSQSWSMKGPLPAMTGDDATVGAVYADAQGYLYASSNPTGNIWRIDVDNVTATLISTATASSSNDGARCAEALIPIDFGDALSSYNTLLSDNGPRHSVAGYDSASNTASLMLGKNIDIEPDGFPGAEANGDDTHNFKDEDGVTHIVATPSAPTSLSIPVTVTNNNSQVATLAGWVDLDNDGTFEAGERVTTEVPASSGKGTYELNFPETTFTSDSQARFRVYEGSVSDPQPTGSASDGEVEDYLVQVGTYEVMKTSAPTDGTTVQPGDTVTYTLNIKNTGLTDLIGLQLHDNLTDALDDATFTGDPIVEPASAGTAAMDHDDLQFIFTGDILAGQTVTVSYSVEVNSADAIGNGLLHNMVVGAHSNCHPDVSRQDASVSDPDCQTDHPVNASVSLAETGGSWMLPLAIAGSSFIAGVGLYVTRRFLKTARI